MPKSSRQKSAELADTESDAEERPVEPLAIERQEGHVSGTLPIAVSPEEALRRARDSFRTLASVSVELVLVYRDNRVVEVNPSAVSALALSSRGDIVGASLEEIFLPDGRESIAGHLRALREAKADADLPQVFELRWRRKDGAYLPTEAAVATIDHEGRPAAVIVARDITERAEFQHRLLQRDRMAALGTLSAGVAHEINNPLTYLLVNLEHVLRRLRAAGASDDPIAELARGGNGSSGLAGLAQSLQQAIEGANRVKQIVRDLLTFSQGNVEHRGMVDVRGIVESAAQMAWHEIRHRARLLKSMAEVPPVEANEARLGQVFLNLLVNAAQAIPEGQADRQEIRIVTRTDDKGNAVVEVSDTGVGIAPESMPRIFDPFFTTKGDSGTGLGLSISHGTVKALGGEIQVASTPGLGTTFRVVLPPAKRWRGPQPPKSTDAGAHPRRRVLIIDDERLVGEAIARSLSDDNDVSVVTDAGTGLARITAGERFDVILCDLMMPVMTGMDLYAEMMRLAPKHAGHLVFMTGGAFTPRARAFLESVVNPCLEKPLDMGKLRSLVARAGRE
jgi:PAS domain S-box-containing protein